MAALRSLNDDFRTLSDQSRPSCEESQTPRRTSRHIYKDIERCRLVRTTSQQVYNALGRACTKHTEHLAHFNLHVEQGENLQDGHAPDMKFKLAFQHVSLVGSSSGEPLWFMVDSILHDSCDRTSPKESAELECLGISLKRQFQSSTPCAQKPSPKRVHFQSMSPAALRTTPSTAISNKLLTTQVMRRDFCGYLRKYIRQAPIEENICIGMLEATEGCRHLVYPLKPMFDGEDRHGTSLECFLTSRSTKKHPLNFPLYERLCLAKNLSLAVLQYYATPWLKIAWRSRDILFFDEGTENVISCGPNIRAPHLNVKVIGADGQHNRKVQASRSLAPNPVLFGLGVIFIEIAYSDTIQSLQQPCDLENGMENHYTEFFTAKRVVNSIGREMGSSYGTIVKKLLQCDFGCGDDLDNRDLQAVYYSDVVCELDRLEQGFRQLQIGKDYRKDAMSPYRT